MIVRKELRAADDPPQKLWPAFKSFMKGNLEFDNAIQNAYEMA
jgi:hypothetical protein